MYIHVCITLALQLISLLLPISCVALVRAVQCPCESSQHQCRCCTLQSHRSDRETRQRQRQQLSIRWQSAHRALIPQLISHAQIRRAPVLSQLVFICSLPLWLFQPSLQYSARADLQLFMFLSFFCFGEGASEAENAALPCTYFGLIMEF